MERGHTCTILKGQIVFFVDKDAKTEHLTPKCKFLHQHLKKTNKYLTLDPQACIHASGEPKNSVKQMDLLCASVQLRKHEADSVLRQRLFLFPPQSRRFHGLPPERSLNEHSNHFVIRFNWKLMDWRDLICSRPGKHEVNNMTGILLLRIAD